MYIAKEFRTQKQKDYENTIEEMREEHLNKMRSTLLMKGLTYADKINTIAVRWVDGYLEEFKATEARFGSDILWMRLVDGKERIIPLRNVRWFSQSIESHQVAEEK